MIPVLAASSGAVVAWLALAAAGVGAIVWGAEAFAEHLSEAAVRLRVAPFALALLLAGAEPEELATAVTASLRKAPAIALGDVIGANVAVCLVAFAVAAWITHVPFDGRVLLYAAGGLLCGVVATILAWDGRVARAEGALAIAMYVVFVGVIWRIERRPPELGETSELAEAQERAGTQERLAGQEHAGAHECAAGDSSIIGERRVGRELGMVVAGVVAMATGAIALVEGIRRISGVEETQTKLGLVLVGFATGFELVVLAWASARRGITSAVVAGIVGSYAYNTTMTLGAGALARPLQVVDSSRLHAPWLTMSGALVLVMSLAAPSRSLRRPASIVLLAAYVGWIALVLV